MYVADSAAERLISAAGLRDVRTQTSVDASAALVVLLVPTISVYKPRGLTRYGRGKRRKGYPSDAGSA